MSEENMVQFLTRMGAQCKRDADCDFSAVALPDLYRLVQTLCIHEAQEQAREERFFQRLCASGAQFHEA